MSYQPPPAPTDSRTAASPPESPRRLVRRTDDRVIAGVASGLADYLNIDPVIVRVLFVILAFAGGGGILAYVALWILTPEADGPAPFRDIDDRGVVFWVAIGLLVLGGLALIGTVMPPLSGIVWPLLLIGAGVALWRSDQVRNPRARTATAWPATAPASSAPTANPPTGPSDTPQETSAMATDTDTTERMTPPAAATTSLTDEHGSPAAGGTEPPTPPTPPAPPVQAPPPPDGWSATHHRRRSSVGRVTLALALVTAGVLAALVQAGVLALATSEVIAWVLVVVAAGLLLSAFVGRARGLIWLGALVLVPALLFSSLVETTGIDARDGVGERSIRPTAITAVEDNYRYGVGQLTLDLRDLDLDTDEVVSTASLGIGQLVVWVPADATVEVTYAVGLGEMQVDNRMLGNGRRVEGTTIIDGQPGGGQLTLDLSVGIGQIEIRTNR
jgi:phage shock protein PspC (stress-responsive transcriptional regulator)/predicted membrane protein